MKFCTEMCIGSRDSSVGGVTRHLEVRHPRCVGSTTKNFVYYTYSETQLYLPISTVRIQLHVSVLHVDLLQVEIFNLQISYTRCVGHFCGWGGDEISLFQ